MRVRGLIPVLLVIALLATPASALYYRQKPSVTVSIVGTNRLHRGENLITVTVYNPAEERRVIYDNEEQALFFKGREVMLFTAYNVSIRLEGCRGIEVETPVQRIPALPPMKPVVLKFLVKVKDFVKAGRHTLHLKVSYDVIRDVDVTFGRETYGVPTVVNSSGNVSVITRYVIQPYLSELYIDYDHVSKDIPLTVWVVREPVRLKVVRVEERNFRALGKGTLYVFFKNVGEKVGRDAYITLIPPPGFSVCTMGVYVGNLTPGRVFEVRFPVLIGVKDPGNYTFQIKAVYLDQYGRVRQSYPVPFGVKVLPPPSVKVLGVNSTVYVGATGDVRVRMEFTGSMKEASAILRVYPPLSALSSEYYLGNVTPGRVYVAVFKVEALKEASPVRYPGTIVVRYKSVNEWMQTVPVKIGIKVHPKIEFKVIGVPKIAQGQEKIISVLIKNIGNFTVREATARITVVDPFTTTDDTAYIGTLRPGQEKVIKFRIRVEKDATPKVYGLNLEVKYKDPEGDWVISEPTKLVIEVVPAGPNYMLIAALVAVGVISAALAFKRRGR